MGTLKKGIRFSSNVLGKATEIGAKGAGKVISSVAKASGREDIAKKTENISQKIAGNAEKYSDKIGKSIGDLAEKAVDKGIDKAGDIKEKVKTKVENRSKKSDKFIVVDKYEID